MPELTKTIATTADTLATLINVGVETEVICGTLKENKKDKGKLGRLIKFPHVNCTCSIHSILRLTP